MAAITTKRHAVPGRLYGTGALTSRRRILIGILAGAGSIGLVACGAGTEAEVSTIAMPNEVTSVPAGGSKLATDLSKFPRGEARPAPDVLLNFYQGEQEVGGANVLVSELISSGKPLVLNFWAGLCPPCRAEMPDLQAAYIEKRDQVNLIGIDVGPFIGLGSIEEGRELAEELGVTYPLATTADANVVRDYKVLGMPTTVFITPDGAISRVWTGLMNKDLITQLMDELLAESF